MAECHPVGFQWVMEAKLRGATVIHVDPRFSRTSAVADVFVPIRAGSDIAFLGAIVNHILENGREFRDYVVAYTNASAILSEDFQDTEDLDGLFSGWDPETRSYDNASWQYAGTAPRRPATPATSSADASQGQQHGARARPSGGRAPQTDPTLEHPRCVFQVLKRHFPRYTPELVEEVCGVPRDAVPRGGRGAVPQLGPRAHVGPLLRRGLDPAHRRRAVHPHRGHHPAPAGQHRPAGRRHPGPAGPRQHPGVHRHPHPLRPPPRLPGHAPRRACTPTWPPTSPPGGRRPAPGPTSTPTWSACSRRGGATTPPPRTTSASTTCPASPATTPPSSTCSGCSTAR